MEQYIPKSALVAEIERIMNEQQEICKADVAHGKKYPDDKNVEVIYQFQRLIKFLDTLEVKEVDLDKHLKEDIEDLYFDLDGVAVKGATHYITVEDVKDIAKRFFELGVKTQKGE